MSAKAYYNGDQQQYQPPAQPYQPIDSNQKQGYDMKGSQPYAQGAGQSYAAPSYPPPQQQQQIDAEYGGDKNWGDTAPHSQQTQETGARFNPKTRLNDPIFLVLFIANLVGWAVVSAIAIRTFVQYNGLGGGLGSATEGGTGSSITLNYHTVYLLLCVCGLSLAVAFIWLLFVRAFTKIIMEVTLALTVILNIGICIWYFITKYWSGAIIFAVIALISIVSYFFMRSRIPFTKLLVQTVIDVSKHHPSVYFVVIIGLIIEAALSVWYSFTIIAIYVKWTPNSAACVSSNSCSQGKVIGLIVYSTFSFFWTSQVVANIVLCTLAGGVYGGWYYYGPRMNDGTGLPKNASWKAMLRACTVSLGSIAFGSLIVTLLELLEAFFRMLQQSESGQGDTVGAILACCAACCVSCIRGMVEWFNKYAYIEISLYGKAYIPAAKDTWKLLKDRGIDALVNDSLVSILIMWGSYINGFLCGLFAYVYLRFTKPSYNAKGQYTAPVILFSFVIGINLSVTIGRALDAGVSTIFVGLGEHPMVLAQRAPVLFELIRQQYPRVVQGVPQNY